MLACRVEPTRTPTEVCRLAAWMGPEIAIEDLLSIPEHSLVTQSQAATEAKLAVNGDGFGFAWYAENSRLGLYRDVLPAWGDDNLASLATMIRSGIILAHVRASTFGGVSRYNCHPFVSGQWSFMHNGQLANFGQHRRQLEAELSDKRFRERTGNTDSELLFLLLLDHGLENDVQGACDSVLELLDKHLSGSGQATRITAVLSDGKRLCALRTSTDSRSPTLYVQQTPSGGVLLASEPLDRNADLWQSVDEGVLMIADATSEPCFHRVA